MLNDGFRYNDLGAGGYNATHRGSPHQVAQRITPNFEKKEGDRFGLFQPARYLPSVRLEVMNHDHFVIAAGSPCANDSEGYSVPAGYALLGAGEGPQYAAADIQAGVRNAEGNIPAAGDYVIDSVIAKGLEFGSCIGVASYDVYMNLNSDVHNPATYQYNNYNRQNGFSILTHYLLEFPVEPLKRTAVKVSFTGTASLEAALAVEAGALAGSIKATKNKDQFDIVEDLGSNQITFAALAEGDELVVTYLKEEAFYASPFPGMTTWRGEAAPHQLVSFNKESKFVVAAVASIDDTDLASVKASVEAAIAAEKNIIGIITKVDAQWPKQMLDLVKTAYDERLYSPVINPETGEFTDGSGLDKMPGSATDGVPHAIQYAGGDLKTGMVTFKLKL